MEMHCGHSEAKTSLEQKLNPNSEHKLPVFFGFHFWAYNNRILRENWLLELFFLQYVRIFSFVLASELFFCSKEAASLF